MRRRSRTNAAFPSRLAGKIFDETGQALTPSHATKNGRRYRYYVSKTLIQESGSRSGEGWRLPAGEIEAAAINAIRNERDIWLILEAADKGSIDDQELLSAVARVEIRDADLLIDVEPSVCL